MSNHPQHCHDYCCSRFCRYVDDFTDDAGDGLQGEVHPIFARENFRGDVNYEAITPSLKLVSKILQSDSMIHFVTTMIDGIVVDYDWNPITVEHFRVDPRLPYEEAAKLPWYSDYAFVEPCSSKMNLERRARAAYILQNLAKLITFEVIAEKADGDMLLADWERLDGLCFADHAPMPNDRLAQFRFGRSSRIVLCPNSGYREILDLIAVQEQWKDESWHKHQLLMARFSHASSVLHELAHAVQAARFGMMRRYEVFFDDCPLNKAGYLLQGLVFGGTMSPSFTRDTQWYLHHWNGEEEEFPSPFLVLYPWPSYHKEMIYSLNRWPIARSQFYSTREQLKRISASYVKALFTDSFWDAIHEKGMTALHPKHVAHWAFETADVPEDWTPSHPEPLLEEWRYAKTAADLGPRRAHQVLSCPFTEQADDWCDEYIPPGSEADILSTSIDGLVDGTLNLPVPPSPSSSW